MSRPPSTPTNTIAFRAPADLLAALDADAKRFNLSRGELVRAIAALHYDTQPAGIREDLRKSLTKLGLIHRNQARMLVSLLTTLGKLPLEEAKQIVRADLLS
jgi:hypothetical protein